MIPEELKAYKLKDIASVQTGPFGTQLHQKDYVATGTPIITVEHLGANKILHSDLPRVSDQDKERLKKYSLFEGDIVFSRVGSVDRRAYVGKEEVGWLFSGRCLRIRSNSEIIHSKYLSYYFGLESFKKYIRGIAVGATMPSLNTDILKEIVVKIPSKQTQYHIASILSSLDNKIELNLQMNKTLESFAQAIFKEWFVDFRFPGYDGELVNGLPVGWRKEILGSVIEVKGGSTPSTTAPEFWNGGLNWATPKDLSSYQSPVLLNTERTITKEGVKQISSGILPKGILLLSSRAPIGYLAISQIPVSINQGFIAIQGREIGNLFMLFWLKNNMDSVKSRANGSTFQEISKSNFKEIEIIVPSRKLLETFDNVVGPIFEKIVTNVRQNQSLAEIRDKLLPKLMTGKIKVA